MSFHFAFEILINIYLKELQNFTLCIILVRSLFNSVITGWAEIRFSSNVPKTIEFTSLHRLFDFKELGLIPNQARSP